ncbi:MAG: hypothetical protein KJ645_02965, partial [Planctomycetes bacterium]|nr:hypothetical protein [Planctomycetota bacterium]
RVLFRSWLNPDLKIYSTDITLENGTGKLKPGMSAKVEIIVDQLKQVISVPIQSVYRRGGHEVCYVKSSGSEVEIRPVEVGMNNDQFVVIEEGLVEGEKVLLFEPSMGDSQEDKSSPDPESAAQRGETPENPVEGSSRETDARQDESQRPRAMQPEGVERAMPAGAPTEEMRNTFEKFKDMTPEEREKAMEKMRAEGGFPSGGRDRGRDRGSDRSRGEKPDQGE